MYNDPVELAGELRRLLEHEPFNPILLVTTAGQAYKIAHPQHLVFGLGLCIVIPKKGMTLIPMHQIAAVEVAEPE